MSLPVLNLRDVSKAPSRKGFRPVRQRGSHIIVEAPNVRFVTVPRLGLALFLQ
ncbi:MAG: type II toxin-antitoxin system HicA family toxin [Nitrososphaerota archaeon]|nr:type II toxin-antitoxin system HicA family toxin [Nitrososphaerota archaeon]